MAITLRSATQSGATTKGSPLTHAEMDANFTSFMSSDGGSLVGFKQAGSGVSTTSVQTELRRTIWAEHFGAVGDASTDNAVAIQAAIDYADDNSNGGVGYDVYLGKGTFIIQSQVKTKNKVRLIGSGRSATLIQAGSSFPINTPLIRMGDGTGVIFSCCVEQMTVDANNVSGSTCIYTTEAQEHSGVRHVVCYQYRSKGIDFATTGAGVFVEDVECYPSTSGSTSGIELTSADMVSVKRITVNGTSGGVHTNGILVTSSVIAMEALHFEGVTNGVKLSTNATGSISGVRGPSSGINVTNLIYFDGSTAFVAVTGVFKSSATNSIKDDLYVTLTEAFIRAYFPRHFHISGSYIAGGFNTPEASITGTVGSTFHCANGAIGTSYYIKETGSSNTGWRRPMHSVLAVATGSNRNLTLDENLTNFNNTGATARQDFTLPSAVTGLGPYTFTVLDTDGLRVIAGGGDTIRIAASVSAAAGRIDSTTIGDSVTLHSMNATEWVATSLVGAGWTAT